MAATSRASRSRLEAIRPTSPLQAGLAVAAAAVFIVFLALHSRSGETAAPAPTQPQAGAQGKPTEVTPADIAARSAETGQRIYWVGPRPATTYELNEDASGNVFVRYLPAGTPAGATGSYTTIGTYRFPNAYKSTQAIAKEPGAIHRSVPRHGIAVFRNSRPNSIYVAYPGLGYQIEIYDPDADEARRLAVSGALRPAGGVR